jgi:hypothetical protein
MQLKMLREGTFRYTDDNNLSCTQHHSVIQFSCHCFIRLFPISVQHTFRVCKYQICYQLNLQSFLFLNDPTDAMGQPIYPQETSNDTDLFIVSQIFSINNV